ncbi:WD40-repeat-containing domain protein [Cokeromyces recurvatus]|uniref:WD40-repeat-containing domain protein n=1 Tax=Cokeromyces recurvatus TaxID=90255 RepID=UPI00221EAD05|nr:WD40-repeat-containing domain protein [Cokeromyces recurvatus]KAI7903725.1 WD40-repeat-containing domain protein [Cokeromyces recurvatus]
MDLLNNYGSSDEEDNNTIATLKQSSLIKVNSVPDTGFDHISGALYTAPTATELTVNVPYNDMNRPVLGPDNPFSQRQLTIQNVVNGHVEQQAISEMDFRTQYRTFETYGYARDPSLNTTNNFAGQTGEGLMGTGYVGNLTNATKLGGVTIHDRVNRDLRPNKDARKKRNKKGKLDQVDGPDAYMGPWAGYEDDNVGIPTGLNEEQVEQTETITTQAPAKATEFSVKNIANETHTETTIFHGASEHDYLGRTYMAVPQDVDVNLFGEPGQKESFIPKKLIHTWEGHEKGVSSIKFFPKSAHLLLSAGMDNQIKIWDVYHDRSLLRSYLGHSKAVRDIAFNNDGTKFLSASYDRNVKLWDTETGKCIRTFSTGRLPYCCTFNPAKQNIFLAGYSDKKIVQFDINTGEITQEYDQHLGAVNTITFVDENRRFVTTSDDKTMRAWEFDIPVVIKYIAEPDMYAIPAVTLSPNKKWLACQSLDNQILIYGARDKFRLNRKKRFAGHLIAGYACKPGFSPDGRFISSGDSNGNVWFWDWKTCKILKKLKAHEKVVTCTEWHPHETSKVATSSWDGLIKYWD